MSLIYTSFKKRKRNKLPLTPSLLEARRKHRKYLISLGIDPDRKISKRNFRVIPNWWEVGKPLVTEPVKHSISTDRVQIKVGGTKPHNNWRLEESRKFTVAPAYNKGAYQVITKSNIKDIGR